MGKPACRPAGTVMCGYPATEPEWNIRPDRNRRSRIDQPRRAEVRRDDGVETVLLQPRRRCLCGGRRPGRRSSFAIGRVPQAAFASDWRSSS